DDQNSFLAAAHFAGRRGVAHFGFDNLGSSGEENFESGASANLAGDFNPSFVLFNNAINSGQTETGAFADFFGRKERLEDPPHSVGIHAAAGIGDLEANERTGARFWMGAHIIIIELHWVCA